MPSLVKGLPKFGLGARRASGMIHRCHMRDATVQSRTQPRDDTLSARPNPAPRSLRTSVASPGVALRERVSAGIVAAAAEVLARDGAGASMADVAAAAGVARATVYRYFPTRQALLERLAAVAVEDAGARLAETQLQKVRAEEGVTRAVRALLEVGDYFTVLARERVRPDPEEYESRLIAPLRQLFEQGQATGVFRDDIPTDWLTNALVDLVVSVVPSAPALGRDDTVEAVSGLFLDGARARRLAGEQS
jgi:TetR/AcrR family transcriptional repressor of mexCD-oprJ operon